jgi:MOSC domain-containing protein
MRSGPARLSTHQLLPSSARGVKGLPVTVSQLAITPVKGMRLQPSPEIQLAPIRMTITVTGADPRAEHSWSGQHVTIADIALRVLAPVPRCVVTTCNPESGATDARVLHTLARLRGKNDITFGVWCEIVRAGRIQVGDLVIPSLPHAVAIQRLRR